MTRLASAYRYLSTYWVLLQHFALSRGKRFWFMVLAVLCNAFVHPIPFLLIAELLRGAQAGSATVVLGWQRFTLQLQPDLAVLLVFILGTGAYVLSYLVGRLVNSETVAWQGQMFWRLAGGLGQASRWDRKLDFGVALTPMWVAARLDNALRGAFPIGRLIETGLRDFVMVTALLSLLIWQDARDVAVLGFISLLFLPAYGAAIARLVQMQAKSNAQLMRLRQPVISLLTSDFTRRAGQAIDEASIAPSVTRALSQSFGNQSYLLNELNAVTVVGGVHVFAAFYGVFLSEGRSLIGLPTAKLSFLFFLLLMLRSLISLVGLISRLSRGYERLGTLRALLLPAAKTPPRGVANEAGSFVMTLPEDAMATKPEATPATRKLRPGDTVLYLAPDVSFGFQLLPFANALQPLFAAAADAVRHIPLLEADDVPALLAGGTVVSRGAALRLPLAGQIALKAAPVNLLAAPVVALRQAAWQRLVREKQTAAAGRGRVLVLVATGLRIPPTVPPGTLVVRSNGKMMIAAGDIEPMRGRLATMAAGGGGSLVEAAEDEEQGVEE